jgi:magnesium-protoporphyrin O-methyltransferase
VLFTFAPRTLPLTLMHVAGRLFPRGDRAPAIEPVAEATLRRLVAAEPALKGWRPGRTERVAGGFYISQALELVAR